LASPSEDKTGWMTAVRHAIAGPEAMDRVEVVVVAAGIAARAGKAGQHLAIGDHGGGKLPPNQV
jgi:hypothetical protein